jgi:hypothetical protein
MKPVIVTTTDHLPKLDWIYDALVKGESLPPLENGLPALLYRGERDAYPMTVSSMDRFYHVAKKDMPVYHELDELTAFVMSQPFPEKLLKGREAGAYAQHYGLPTQIFDFTSSAKIAMNFAANRSYHRNKALGGHIAILEVDKALKAGCIVEDLRGHKYAKRAELQQAFGVIYMGFKVSDIYDLKDPEIIKEIGLTWIPYQHFEDDETFLKQIDAYRDILSTNDDLFAGLAQEFVDEFVMRKGKFSAKAATILASNIPAVSGRTIAGNINLWSKQV